MEAGATVIIADLNEPPSHELVSEFRQSLVHYQIDVGSKESLSSMESELSKKPTILVNNAAIQNNGKSIEQLGFEEIDRIVKTNLLAGMYCTKIFLPYMKEKGSGHIINMASCLGLGGLNNVADYCATKFGVVGFNESLRLELKTQGYHRIKTTIVCPFLVNTGMFANLRVAHPLLTPPLSTEEVAEAIFDAIRYRNRDEIWMPKSICLLPLVRLFPCALYDFAQQLIGSTNSYVYDKGK